MTDVLTVTGLPDMSKMMTEIGPRMAANIMRATVHGIASDAAKEIKRNAPKDTGNLRKNIKAKRRKSKPEAPVSDVNIGPSAFYWRFFEDSTKNQPEKPFVRPVVDAINADIENLMKKMFGKKLEKSLKALAKKQAKGK